MPVQQDLILKMIEQLAAAFGRVFAGRPVDAIDDPAEAILELEQALAGVLHVRPETIDLQPADLLDRVDAAVAAELATLFVARAQLAIRIGLLHVARPSLTRAIDGLLRKPSHRRDEEGPSAADTARTILRDEPLATLLTEDEIANAWQALFAYEADHRRYAAAEDALFAALALRPHDPFLARGQQFYEDLLTLDDAAIERGGLTREEVLGALEELHHMDQSS